MIIALTSPHRAIVLTAAYCFFLCLLPSAFCQWAVTNKALEANVFLPSGAAVEHKLKVTVQTNGNILISGNRYDFSATSVLPFPTNGTPVTKANSPASLLGPVTVTTNFYKWTNTMYIPPAYTTSTNIVLTNTTISATRRVLIFLSDGTKMRGRVSIDKYSEQRLDWTANNLPLIVTTNYPWSSSSWSGDSTRDGGFGEWFDPES